MKNYSWYRESLENPLQKSSENEEVNHPDHYTVGGVEVLDVIRAKAGNSGFDPFQGYNYGNIIKYILRAPYKGTLLKDLRKAKLYLEWLIESIEKD